MKVKLVGDSGGSRNSNDWKMIWPGPSAAMGLSGFYAVQIREKCTNSYIIIVILVKIHLMMYSWNQEEN